MTLRLGVYRAPWRARIARITSETPGLLPVVKGAGYGIGQHRLMRIAVEIGAGAVGVGTIHELASVPAGIEARVLTPALTPPDRDDTVMPVGSLEHLAALKGWHGRVVIKLRSRMRRFGVGADEVTTMRDAVEQAGLRFAGYSLHPPTATTEAERVEEVLAWTERLPAPAMLSVSHLEPASYAHLRSVRPGLGWQLRAGTALWHGDKSALRLEADVLDVRPVRAGEQVGYRQVDAPGDGTVVIVGAGTAHGVAPLLSGGGGAPVSPFHHARTPPGAAGAAHARGDGVRPERCTDSRRRGVDRGATPADRHDRRRRRVALIR